MSKFVGAIVECERTKAPDVQLLESGSDDDTIDGTPCRGVFTLLKNGDKFMISCIYYSVGDEEAVLASLRDEVSEDEDWLAPVALGEVLDDIEEEGGLSEAQKDFLWKCRAYVPIAAKDLN